MPEAACWLLLLGSSRDDDGPMRAALAQLERCGSARWLTPIRRFPADDGSGLLFHNALAAWQAACGETEAYAEIRRIETALGRDRGRRDEVAIDIDLLARLSGGQWQAHAHARDKREFARLLVRALLLQAGITVIDA